MVMAITLIAFWVILFLAVVIIPFLPQVDTAHAPAPRAVVPRAVEVLPTAPHERAA
jgi:hypothetical protein